MWVKVIMSIIATAVVFLSSVDFAGAQPHGGTTSVSEYYALRDLYISTNGDSWRWKALTSGKIWEFDNVTDPCDHSTATSVWQGLTCIIDDSSGSAVSTISEIFLDSYNLQGHIPDSFGDMTSITFMELSYNSLSGTLPSSIGGLTNLQQIRVRYNSLSGSLPEGLADVSGLLAIFADYNSFTGSIPQSYGNFRDMILLLFDNNQLTGTIPSTIGLDGSYINCQYFRLQTNRLTGTLPAGVNVMSKLLQLDVGANVLSGPLNGAFTALPNLQAGWFRDNHFTGPFPDFITTATSLLHLSLGVCSLTGALPAFEGADFPSLVYFDIEDNSFTGSLPEGLFDAIPKVVDLKLELNAFDGTLPPSFSKLQSVTRFMIDYNRITGTFPSQIMKSIVVLNIQHGYFSGTIPFQFFNATAMVDCIADFNLFTGSVPTSIGLATNMKSLTLMGNQLSGTIPVEISNLVALKQILIYHNKLTGTLPEELGSMTSLTNFRAHNNRFTGTLPQSLTKLTSLNDIELSYNCLTGTIPNLIERISNLASIGLSNNLMKGTLPSGFGKLSSLQDVALHGNSFTGSLHGVFNTSVNSKLKIIDISENEFTGTIPENIFESPAIESFIVIKNCMISAIPATVCSASTLKSLVLDGISSAEICNRRFLAGTETAFVAKTGIFGTIPRCLFSLPALETLHVAGNAIEDSIDDVKNLSASLKDLSLSHNQLHGSIPSSIQQHNWTNLDLSYNKISGYLENGLMSGENYVLNVRINRLSGYLPPTIYDANDVNLLHGNRFTCNPDHSDLPAEDPDTSTYSCGSELFDYTAYSWLIVSFLFASGMICVIAYRHGDVLTGLRIVYTEASLTPAKIGSDTVSKFTLFAAHLRLCLLYMLAFVCGMGLLYVMLMTSYKTYTYTYAWYVSAGFMSGVVPGTFVLLGFASFLGLTYYIMKVMLPSCGTPGDMSQNMSLWSSGKGQSQEKAHSPMANADDFTDNSGLTNYYIYLTFATIVNISLVIGVNVAYVVAILKGNRLEIIVSELALSVFKIVWNNIIIDILLGFGERRFITSENARNILKTQTDQFQVTFRNLILIGNMVTAPCISAVMVSPECFYNVLVSPDAIDSPYSYDVCSAYNFAGSSNGDVDCVEYTTVQFSQSYTPAFTYSYSCSGYLLISFVPVFVFMAIIITFIMPVAEYTMEYIREKGICTQLQSVLNSGKPTAAEANTPKEFRKYLKKTLNTVKMSGKFVAFLAVFCTFGLTFPPLGCIVFIQIAAMVYRMQNTYHQIANELIAAEKLEHLPLLDQQSAHIGSYIRRSVWILLMASALYYSLFVFDIFGDVLAFAGASWAPIVILLIPPGIWIAEQVNIYISKQGSPQPNGIDKSYVKEMDVSENPIRLSNMTFGSPADDSNRTGEVEMDTITKA